MLLMLWLVLTTGLMLINITTVLVILVGIFLLILDTGFVVKLWNLIDAVSASKRDSKEF